MPETPLPKNFKVIYSQVKPVQCVEIALKCAEGEVIHWTADDTTYNDFAFDEAYNLYLQGNRQTMVAFRNIEDGVESTEQHYFYSKDAPRMMPFGIMNREYALDLGRVDRRFIAGQWDNDLVMRAYSKGSNMLLSIDSIAYTEHNKKHGSEWNLRDVWDYETKLLKSLWFRNGKWNLQRFDKVENFQEENILTITQEPTGRWKNAY